MAFRDLELGKGGDIKKNKIPEKKEKPFVVKEMIEKWLNETPLSEEAKKKLLEKSLEIQEKIEPLSPSPEKKAKTSLFLACDAYSCAIVKGLVNLKPEAELLARARKETGIKRVEAIQRVETMCKLLGRSEEVAKRAKEILKEYKERHPSDYSRYSPSGMATAAIWIAAIFEGEHITQRELKENLGISDMTIRSRWKKIADKLGIEIFP
jgi:transcription initiation factor TFIIIB Brf1 subunit/transcription initiation factor TFIIB